MGNILASMNLKFNVYIYLLIFCLWWYYSDTLPYQLRIYVPPELGTIVSNHSLGRPILLFKFYEEIKIINSDFYVKILQYKTLLCYKEGSAYSESGTIEKVPHSSLTYLDLDSCFIQTGDLWVDIKVT